MMTTPILLLGLGEAQVPTGLVRAELAVFRKMEGADR